MSRPPLRLLHVIRSADPATGGPIEAVRQLSAVHLRLGHSVEVLSLDSPQAGFIAEFPFPIHAVGNSSNGYGHSARCVPWLRENHRRFDAVIANGLWQYGSLAVWRALRNSETPYFVYPHGMLDPWFKRAYPLKHLKKCLYWPWAEYWVLRGARAVLFTCDEERRLARQSFWLYRCREKVVNLGTTAPALRPEQVEIFLSAFPVLRGCRLFLFLGRLHEKKGCDLLLKAFGRWMAEDASARARCRLVMAGPCADETYLRGLQALALQACPTGSVLWPGMLSGDLKWGAFQAAEVFALPSHQENFGLAVAEALACGVPALISNQVNIWREIEQDGAGLIEPDNEEGTLRLFRRWSALGTVRQSEMRSRAKDCFQRRFEIERAAQSMIDAVSTSVGRDSVEP